MAPRRPRLAFGLGGIGWTLLVGQLALTSARAEDASLKSGPDPIGNPPSADFGTPLETTFAGAHRSESPAIGKLVYVPRQPPPSKPLMSGLVRAPLDGGGTRATVAGGARGEPLPPPTVLVLAPPKLAHSLSTRPTLYWYLSGPSAAPVRLSVHRLDDPKPALEVDLGMAPTAGVYATSLAEHGISLKEGSLYRWSVAIEVDPEAAEKPVAHTILATAEADPALSTKLAGAPPLARIQALAGAGYWYDALDLLTQQIVANDTAAPWRDLHAGLLEQVGLSAVAAFERGAAQ